MYLKFDNIAVVGRGPSVQGKWWGEAIDKHSCVVRNWDDRRRGHNFGEKLTLSFYQISPKFINQMVLASNVPVPEIGFIGSYLRGVRTAYNNTVDIFDQEPWVTKAKLLGGESAHPPRLLLTKGTVAAAWSIEHCRPGGHVTLVGFDFVYKGYAIGGRYGLGKLERWRRHDYSIEKPFLKQLAAKKKVKLQFTQDVWK